MKSRQKVTLRESLSKRLGGYAAAAGTAGIGLLATAQPASADIIYTPANVSMVPGTPTIVPIDINHDGAADFNFFDQAFGFSEATLLIGTVGRSNAFLGYRPYALNAGAPIGAGRNFWTYGGMMAFIAGRDVEGYWPGATNKFAGLYMFIKAKTTMPGPN